MSFYVRRQDPARMKTSWTGPIRSERQAGREADAWNDAGWAAEIVPSSAEIRAEVRRWVKEKKRCR